jgi:hypothetical protein
MGLNTLDNVIPDKGNFASDLNQYKAALKLDLVPRNSLGVPENEAGSLGTELLQWKNLYTKTIYIDGRPLTPEGIISNVNTITSGRIRPSPVNSYKSDFIQASGISNSAVILATITNLILNLNDETVTIESDINITSLAVAPSTNNTCQVNDKLIGDFQVLFIDNYYTAVEPRIHLNEIVQGISSGAFGYVVSVGRMDTIVSGVGNADGFIYILKISGTFSPGERIHFQTSGSDKRMQSVYESIPNYGSKYQGEENTVINIDNAGTEITNLIGQYAAFKNETTDEIFIAYIKSSTELINAKRGYFFDNTGAPIERQILNDDDVLTLLKLGWIFVQSDAVTYEVSYLTPIWSANEPTSVPTGQYWYNLNDQRWKRYNGTIWIDIERMPIGFVVMDDTNCIASRSFDFYNIFEEINSIENVEVLSNTEVISNNSHLQEISVNAKMVYFGYEKIKWDITADLESGQTEQNYTQYYLYIDQNGKQIISETRPYKRPDLRGYYHPYNLWRFVGEVYNDGDSHFDHAFVQRKKTDAYLSFTYGLWNRPVIDVVVSVDMVGGGGYINKEDGGSTCFFNTNCRGGAYSAASPFIQANNYDYYEQSEYYQLDKQVPPSSGTIYIRFTTFNHSPYGKGSITYGTPITANSYGGCGLMVKKKFSKMDYFAAPYMMGRAGQGSGANTAPTDGRLIINYGEKV